MEHAFSVASGLDSMVLGEAQILGQLKDAYRFAQEAGQRPAPRSTSCSKRRSPPAKRVRSETGLGANAVSLASATLSLARRVYSDLREHTALMIGAGEMNALVARHLIERRRQAHGHCEPHRGPGAGARSGARRPCAVGLDGPGRGAGACGHRRGLYRQRRTRS